ncbi:hypothetical protein CPB85DRAFT_1493353 [Mucidula mucida]|nr:hypothetical protein CPB85DRAFT_1493353 [Mucidula mucida]
MDPPTVDVSSIAFDNSLGALLIGGLLAMALWGITCIQTYNFFNNNTRDRPAFKLMVHSTICSVLDTFHAAICCHILYHYMVSNYLNVMAILSPVWCVFVSLFSDIFLTHPVGALWSWYAFSLVRGNTLMGEKLVITGKAFQITTFLELDELSTLMYLNFAFGTSSDLMVAIALCYWLYVSRTGIPRFDQLAHQTLMLYTVNTGMIVAIDAAMGVIMYAVMPHNLIFLAGFYLLLSKRDIPKLYLASLNAREGLREWSNQPMSIRFTDLTRSAHRFTTEESQASSRTIREKVSCF